jgi:hypothetical protein
VAADPARPDAGLYALASADRGLALRLDRLLKSAPGACTGTAGPADRREWLADLRQLLVGQEVGQMEWRALHVVHRPEGITPL